MHDEIEILQDQETVRRQLKVPGYMHPCIVPLYRGAIDLKQSRHSFILACELHRLNQPEDRIRETLENLGVSSAQARSDTQSAITKGYEYGCPGLQNAGLCLYDDKRRCSFYREIPRQNRHRERDIWSYGWIRKLSHAQWKIYSALREIERKRGLPAGARLYVSRRELEKITGVTGRYIPRALEAIRELGLIKYRPGKRRGEQRGRAGTVQRIIPIPPLFNNEGTEFQKNRS